MSEERKALERMIGRVVISFLAVVAVWKLTPILWHYLSPFIIAVPVAAMLNPMVKWLEQRFKMKKTPAVLIPLLLLTTVMVLLVYWFVSFGVSQLMTVVNDSPTIINDIVSTIRQAFDRLMAMMEGEAMPAETAAWLRSAINNGLTTLTGLLTGFAGNAVGLTVNMATALPFALIYANFLVMGFYFMTKDYDNIRSFLPGGKKHDPNSSTTKLTNSAVVGLVGYLRMQTTYGILSLLISSLFLSAFGFPYAIPIAMAAATFEFLPLFGNGTLYIPWSIIAFILGDTRTGLLVIILYFLFITIRRTTEPKLLANSIGVSPFASLVGMFVGLQAGGLLGLVGGPVVMSVLSGAWQGHYFDPTIRDAQLLLRYLKRRWQPSEEIANMKVHTIFDKKSDK